MNKEINIIFNMYKIRKSNFPVVLMISISFGDHNLIKTIELNLK